MSSFDTGRRLLVWHVGRLWRAISTAVEEHPGLRKRYPSSLGLSNEFWTAGDGVRFVLHQELAPSRFGGRGRGKLTYLRPLRFLYRFPQVSQLKGFSFSMPSVPG